MTWIIFATLLGGVLAVIVAGAFTLSTRIAQVPAMISYAVGALLGAVFLDILPQAFGMADSLETIAGVILFGILLFFILEKLLLWRHSHQESYQTHGASEQPAHNHGRSGTMILIGDTFHNFVDGVLIAGAFLVDVKLGIVTALAIIAHEVPQEAGDFLILIHSGYTKARALLFNMLSSAAMMVGGILAYYSLQAMEQWIPALLGLSAASMLYVSIADLIPSLHRRPEIYATAQQVVLIALGVGTIWLVGELAHSLG